MHCIPVIYHPHFGKNRNNYGAQAFCVNAKKCEKTTQESNPTQGLGCREGSLLEGAFIGAFTVDFRGIGLTTHNGSLGVTFSGKGVRPSP